MDQLSLNQNCTPQRQAPGAVPSASPVCGRVAKALNDPCLGWGAFTKGDPWSQGGQPHNWKKPSAQTHWDLSPRERRGAGAAARTCFGRVRGLTPRAAWGFCSLRTPARPKRPWLGQRPLSRSCKDDHSPGRPGRLPRLAACLGTSGRGQVQGIKLTHDRAVSRRRGIQAPTRRWLIPAIEVPPSAAQPGSQGRKLAAGPRAGGSAPVSLPRGTEQGTRPHTWASHWPCRLICPRQEPKQVSPKTRIGPRHLCAVKRLPPRLGRLGAGTDGHAKNKA